jgi:similar to stage IV sporulation protein
MRKYARKTRCRMKILKRNGVPFKAFKYRKRKWFFIGTVICLLTVKLFTSMVWNINIIGNENINTKELMNQLEELGLTKGKLKKSIDTFYINYKMMIQREDLAFITIKFDGINANVEIKEKKIKPEIEAKNEHTNIIADKTGIIAEINVLSGVKKVNIGDTVMPGDILVEGIMEMTKQPLKTQYVHSEAEIKARIWYEEEQKMKIEENLDVSQFEHYAYLIACDKIKRQMNENTEIIDEKVAYAYVEDFVITKVIIETLETIGKSVSIL